MILHKRATLHRDNFPDAPQNKLIEAIGVLPVWFTTWGETTPDLQQMTPTAPRACWADFINHVYAHGGGWQNYAMNWKLEDDGTLLFPEDPPMKPIATIHLVEGDVKAHMYEYAFMCVKFSDGVFEVARLD